MSNIFCAILQMDDEVRIYENSTGRFIDSQMLPIDNLIDLLY